MAADARVGGWGRGAGPQELGGNCGLEAAPPLRGDTGAEPSSLWKILARCYEPRGAGRRRSPGSARCRDGGTSSRAGCRRWCAVVSNVAGGWRGERPMVFVRWRPQAAACGGRVEPALQAKVSGRRWPARIWPVGGGGARRGGREAVGNGESSVWHGHVRRRAREWGGSSGDSGQRERGC